MRGEEIGQGEAQTQLETLLHRYRIHRPPTVEPRVECVQQRQPQDEHSTLAAATAARCAATTTSSDSGALPCSCAYPLDLGNLEPCHISLHPHPLLDIRPLAREGLAWPLALL